MTEAEALQAEIDRLLHEIMEYDAIAEWCWVFCVGSTTANLFPENVEGIRSEVEEHFTRIRELRGEE